MEARELRIGNYLRWEDESNDIVVVKTIYQIDGIWFIDYCEINDNPSGDALLQDFNPIPLTEEILLKCGFEKPAYSFNGDIFHLTEWDKYPLNWCVAMNKNGAVLVEKLKYLHQLQNLYFALTGKELDIDLSR